MDWITVFLESTIRMSIPILLASLGLILIQKGGLLNIGVEGLMASGAFFGYAGATISGNAVIGVVCAMIGTTLIATICYGIPCISLCANQAIVGTALNIMCVGLGSFLYRKLFNSGLFETRSITFSVIEIPILSDIPYIGDIFFSQSWFTYFALILTFVIAFIMKRTTIGNNIIAVGESPTAAETLGISVIKYKYILNTFSGMIFGIAGSMLSLNLVGTYSDSMVSGRGYIALAIVILGRYNAIGVLLGSLFFGFAQALQLNLQISGIDISYNLIMMIPYLLTIVAIIIGSKRSVSAPSSLGKPYEKSK